MGRTLKREFMTPDVMDELRYLLTSTADILEDALIDYWLDRGVLLGAHRSGDLIPGDDDIDLRVMHTDWQAIESVLQTGLPSDLRVSVLHHSRVINDADENHPYRWFANNDGEFPIASIEGDSNGIRFHTATALAVHFKDRQWDHKPNLDLYSCRINQHHDCTPACLSEPWKDDDRQYLCLPSSSPTSGVVPMDYVFPLGHITLAGRNYPAPGRLMEYLHHLFGYIGEDAFFDEDIRRWVKSTDGSGVIVE
ncbi:MAG: hypothetical protein DHS20C01_32860 [marine bacterium B5-7]|nr:MAG: hypothetical protein DHS20C01_32860 [marine bacterium B5-7]